MFDFFAEFVNRTGTFPDTIPVDASGPSETDGTEFKASLIRDWWGYAQAVLNRAGLTPTGVAEADGNSQIIEGIQKGGLAAGIETIWNLASEPSVTGHRALLLNGQGILRANFAELDAAVYVGDSNNPTASAYYRADDAGGAARNVAGIYLILPESRGYFTRGLDVAASIDPDGASRDLGSIQIDAFQGHDFFLFRDNESNVGIDVNPNRTPARTRTTAADADYFITGGDTGAATLGKTNGGLTDDGVNGTPRTSSETRPANRIVKSVIWY